MSSVVDSRRSAVELEAPSAEVRAMTPNVRAEQTAEAGNVRLG